MRLFRGNEYLDALADAYDGLSSPVILTDEDLCVVYANAEARIHYRDLCTPEGVRRFVTEESLDAFRKMKGFDVFRLEALPTSEYAFFLLTALYDARGKRAACRLHAERRAHKTMGQRFMETGVIRTFVQRELLSPIEDILTAVRLLRRKAGRDLQAEQYLNLLEQCALKTMRTTGCMADLLDLNDFAQGVPFKVFSPLPLVETLSERYRLSLEKDGLRKDSLVLADSGILYNIFAACLLFLNELTATGQKAHRPTVAIFSDEETVTVRFARERVRTSITDPFEPSFRDQDNLATNLFFVREKLERMNADVRCVLPKEDSTAAIDIVFKRTFSFQKEVLLTDVEKKISSLLSPYECLLAISLSLTDE